MKIFVRDSGESNEHYFVELDSYSTAGNEAEVTDLLVCDKYGELLVGSTFGFMDWKCQRDLIRDLVYAQAGSDLTTYSNLSAEEKAIAAKYIPTKISDLLGFGELITSSGSVQQAFANINLYLKLVGDSREKRYVEIVGYVYRWLGKNEALQAEDAVRAANLKGKYIDRGVMYKSLDTVDGFIDWVLAQESFVADGLKAKLTAATWSIAQGGPSIADFCDNIKNCAEDGMYPIP